MPSAPNLLSAFRIACVPVLLALAWNGATGAFLTLFALALGSDVLDGALARRLGQESDFGARLDQWADFALWVSLPLGAWWLWPEIVRREAPFVILAIVCLLLPTAIAYARYRAVPGYHTWSAKLDSVLMGIGVPLLLIFDLAWPFRLAALFLVVCAIDEIGITCLLRECRHDVRSVFHAARLSRRTASEPSDGSRAAQQDGAVLGRSPALESRRRTNRWISLRGQQELEVQIRELERHEIRDIWSIDRAEVIDKVYYREGDELVLKPEHYDMQGWPPGEPERYGPILLDCFDRGGTFYGAFDGETLIGATVLESRFIGRENDQLQLKFLHVSRRHRQAGLGRTLFDKAVARARELGARRLYLSSTPTENTVRFYLRCGCRVTDDVDVALFELEPEDIHLEFDIPSAANRAAGGLAGS